MAEKCSKGKHTLTEIHRSFVGGVGDCEEEEVVQWCEYCGAIVVDRAIDNRIVPGGISPMRFPQFVIENTG